MSTSPETMYYCRKCGRMNFVGQRPHKVLPCGSQSSKCEGDFVVQSATHCGNCHFQAGRGCPDPRVIDHTPWQGCSAWVGMSAPAPAPVPAPCQSVVPVPAVPAV